MIRLKISRQQRWVLPLAALIIGIVACLMLYRLGSLVGGLSQQEQQAATATYGWHGLWRQPLYLPLNVLRSVAFFTFRHHGQTVIRLPNALLGAGGVLAFSCLVRFWYGGRTAALTAVLFAGSAWTLHVSRLASTDVLYFWALPTLLLAQLALQRWGNRILVFYGTLAAWLMLLFVPGLVGLVVISIFWSRQAWWQAWKHFHAWWQRTLYVGGSLPFLALLGVGLTRPDNLRRWVGLPGHFAAPLVLLKQFGAVPVHLFVRGPQYPDLWLGRAPILDIFTLAMVLLGIYFYARHWRAGRSRLLAICFVVSWLLVALGGPVSLSLIVPLLYLGTGAGIAYLLRGWLQIFPLNPLARGLGIGLVTLAVCLSTGYNLRAYFVAWSHDPTTVATFHYNSPPTRN